MREKGGNTENGKDYTNDYVMNFLVNSRSHIVDEGFFIPPTLGTLQEQTQ